jgi:hypothetical protein
MISYTILYVVTYDVVYDIVGVLYTILYVNSIYDIAFLNVKYTISTISCTIS